MLICQPVLAVTAVRLSSCKANSPGICPSIHLLSLPVFAVVFVCCTRSDNITIMSHFTGMIVYVHISYAIREIFPKIALVVVRSV